MNRHRAAARDLPAAAGWAALLVAALGFTLLTLLHVRIAGPSAQAFLPTLLSLAWILLTAYFTRELARSLTRH